MIPPHELIVLIERFLAGEASNEEIEQVDQELAENPQVAELLAQHAKLESRLRSHFGVQKRTDDVSEWLETTRPQPASEANSSSRSRAIFRWAIGIAASLLVVAGIGWWFTTLQPDEPSLAGDVNRLISGQVTVDGRQVSSNAPLPAGASIVVVEGEPARIRLSDGSEVEFLPQTRAVLLRPRNNVRQAVELVGGAGTFRVAKAEGQFRVDTAVGSVMALGTEFTVALIPDPPREGERKNRRTDALQVEVAEGIVEVEYGRHKLLMAGGEEHLFRDDREPAPAKMVAGRFQSVDLAKHELRIARTNESRRITTHRYAPELTVTIDGQRSRLGDLRPSTSVALTLSLGETVVAVRTVGRKQTGVVRSIDPVGRTIVLAGGRREDGRSQDQIFNLSNTLHVLVDGREAALNEIRPQQRVELEFSVDESQVRRITSATRDREGEKE